MIITVIIWAIIVLCGIAGGLAAWLSRRRPELRPVAVALLVTFGAELARGAVLEFILPPPTPMDPIVGALRWAVYADRALFLVWPFAVAATALRVLAHRAAWPAIGAWVAVSIALAVAYPITQGDVLRRSYLAAELLAAFVSVACIVGHAIRRRRGGEQGPRAAPAGAALMVGGHFASIVFGAFQQNLWGGAWMLTLSANLVTFGALAALFGVLTWKQRTP